jgi:hypothetical protein
VTDGRDGIEVSTLALYFPVVLALRTLVLHCGELVQVVLRVPSPVSIIRPRTALQHAYHDDEQEL